jgi:hypothetical protein
MRPVPESEVRFLLKRGLQQLPRSILRDLGGAADKREAALALAVDVLAARFARLTIQAPDPRPNHG